MSPKRKVLALLLAALMSLRSLSALAEITLEQVNEFLNSSASLGEGSKANPVAIIPISTSTVPRRKISSTALSPSSTRPGTTSSTS